MAKQEGHVAGDGLMCTQSAPLCVETAVAAVLSATAFHFQVLWATTAVATTLGLSGSNTSSRSAGPA